jgi:hypothetical protein
MPFLVTAAALLTILAVQIHILRKRAQVLGREEEAGEVGVAKRECTGVEGEGSWISTRVST